MVINLVHSTLSDRFQYSLYISFQIRNETSYFATSFFLCCIFFMLFTRQRERLATAVCICCRRQSNSRWEVCDNARNASQVSDFLFAPEPLTSRLFGLDLYTTQHFFHLHECCVHADREEEVFAPADNEKYVLKYKMWKRDDQKTQHRKINGNKKISRVWFFHDSWHDTIANQRAGEVRNNNTWEWAKQWVVSSFFGVSSRVCVTQRRPRTETSGDETLEFSSSTCRYIFCVSNNVNGKHSFSWSSSSAHRTALFFSFW